MVQIKGKDMDLKTPYYVIHKEELDNNFNKLKSAMWKYWGNYEIGYSYKTNALPWVIKYFNNLGCMAEVVSEEEYELAKLIGVNKSGIIYNGPIKTKSSFAEAIENGCIVNIDSQREIDWLENVSIEKRKVGIRVNFDIEKMCPGQSQCGQDGGRFGFCYENDEFKKAVEKINKRNASICGIHLHTSSKSRSVDIYKAICEMACKIQREYQFDVEYVDVGGGFFGGLPTKPQFDDYISCMSDILKSEFDKNKTKLIIEPGMSVIGAPVSYVTSVIDVKDTNYNRFVITDGSRTSIDPLMSKTTYFHSYDYKDGKRNKCDKQIICGYTCMEHDRLFETKNDVELRCGDKIIYNKVGAYTMCLTPLFIRYFPEVYVEDKNKYELIRKAWTPNEYIMKSLF